MLVLSTGIGLCTAPTTSVIMTTVPDDKQGVASAVNDATREIGAALGIALAGSMLAANYPKILAPKLIGFPRQVSDAASTSVGQALEVARRLGPAGARLAEVSKVAFIDAMGSSLLVLAVLVAASAVLIGLWAARTRRPTIAARMRARGPPGTRPAPRLNRPITSRSSATDGLSGQHARSRPGARVGASQLSEDARPP